MISHSSDWLYRDGKRYDLQYPGGEDIDFWLTQASRFGGPILELACGTGRVTIPLAREGFEVVGIDISDAMLAEARRKAERERVEVDWVRGDIREFDLGRSFSLIIIPANALLHLLQAEELERCLACVKRHLRPGGKFIVDVFVPNLRILTRKPHVRYFFSEHVDPSGAGNVVVTQSSAYDPASQTTTVKLYRSVAGQDEEAVGELVLRIYYPQELDALLHHSGFKIDEKTGDYDGSGFGPSSPKQLIVTSHPSVTGYAGAGRYYDKIAHLYDTMYSKERGFDHRGQAQWVETWRATLGLPKTMLDLACGTGQHLAVFESLGYACYGIDASREMLRIAASRLAGTALEQGYFPSFRLPTQVPLITCFFNSLAYNRNLDELRRALRNIHRNLSDGGLLVFDLSVSESPRAVMDVKAFEGEGLRVSRTMVGIPTSQGFRSTMYLVVFDGETSEVIEETTLRGSYSGDDVRNALREMGIPVTERCSRHGAIRQPKSMKGAMQWLIR